MTTPPPQYGQQPGYYQAPGAGPQPSGGINGFGLTSLIIGIFGLAICWLPWIGFLGVMVGIVGLVFGILGIALDKYRGRRMLGIVGTVVSGLAFVLSMFLPIFTSIWWTWSWLEQSGTIDRFETAIEQEYETYHYEPTPTDTPTSEVPETDGSQTDAPETDPLELLPSESPSPETDAPGATFGSDRP